MEKKQIDIRLVTSWPEDDIVDLYKAGGWWKDSYEKSGIPRLIKGSFAFAVAVDAKKGHAIGMGRVISDGISDAYIQDLVVFPNYRRYHIGTKLTRALVEYCISQGIGWIGLIAEPGSDVFYQTIGFMPMDKYVPMLYTPEK